MRLHSLFAFFVVGVLSATSAKGHRGRSHHSHGTATQSPDGRPRFNDGEQRKELHRAVTSPLVSDGMDGKASLVSQAPSVSVTPTLKRVKKVSPADKRKTLLHKNAQEHNVNKKQLDDQDGIPMETEFLIHVTPNPPNARKAKKSQAQKRRAATSKAKTAAVRDTSKSARSDKGGVRENPQIGLKPHRNKQRQNAAFAKKGLTTEKRAAKGNGKTTKGHRYPKKYNPQKHNWKKNQKEKKLGDRKKEKRDKKAEKKEKREKRNKRMKTNQKRD